MTMKRYCSNFPARIYSSADSGSVRQPQKLGKVHSAVLPLEVQFTQFLSNVSNWHSTWKAENHFLEWSGVSVFEGDMPDTGMQSLPCATSTSYMVLEILIWIATMGAYTFRGISSGPVAEQFERWSTFFEISRNAALA